MSEIMNKKTKFSWRWRELSVLIFFFAASIAVGAPADREISCRDAAEIKPTDTYLLSIHASNAFSLSVEVAKMLEGSLEKNDSSKAILEYLFIKLVGMQFNVWIEFKNSQELHPRFFRARGLDLLYFHDLIGDLEPAVVETILRDPLYIRGLPPSSTRTLSADPEICISDLRKDPQLYQNLVDEFYSAIGFDYVDGKAKVRHLDD